MKKAKTKKKATKKSKAKTKKKRSKSTGRMGRPNNYRKEYCQMLIDHMAEGRSFETFGIKDGVCYMTLYRWAERYNDFCDAKRIGEVAALDFWEGVGRAQSTGSLRRVKSHYIRPFFWSFTK